MNDHCTVPGMSFLYCFNYYSRFDFSTTHGLDFLGVVPHQKLKLNNKYPKCECFSLHYIFATTCLPPYGNFTVFTGRVCPLVVVTFIAIK